MWEQLFASALSNGLWCALFVILFIYQISDGKKREAKYIRTIEVLTDKGLELKEIKENILEIKEDLKNRRIMGESNEIFKIET